MVLASDQVVWFTYNFGDCVLVKVGVAWRVSLVNEIGMPACSSAIVL
jgi:hypothetical protein